MNNTCNQHGAFSWCELLTSDTEAAQWFYSKLFNWTLEPAPTSVLGVDYTSVKCGERHIGGMTAIPPTASGMPPHWGSFITVDDVDAIVEQAVAMGRRFAYLTRISLRWGASVFTRPPRCRVLRDYLLFVERIVL